MPPPLTARTFAEDPSYMMLYYSLVSLLSATSEKPDYNAIATKASLTSGIAAKRRLDRLLKVQGDAESQGAASTTPTTTPKKAAKGNAEKGTAAKDDGDGGESKSESVKATPKKRKMAAMGGQSMKDDGGIEGVDETVKEEMDE